MNVMRPLEIKNNCINLKTASFTSLRVVTKKYNSLFSIHDTTIYKDEILELCYRKNEEYVYIIEGEGEIYDYNTQKNYKLEPNTIYHVSENDKHRLIAKTNLRGICIFTPACRGDIEHDEDGSY
ncbi:ectoine synthase [Vreelandella titanicae]|uniref:ectoine synthase n=1 Tax=Vreelandella titanicae TaxID=664683 RepID=UPI003D01A075|tara:strand:+ start:409 stop:780 length:372 start_codon:yes stop_codon:yes gene_type:complete